MPARQIAPYGSWASPITSSVIVAGTLRLNGVALDGDDVYWVEGRAAEGGRSVVIRRTDDGAIADVTPQPFNVRSRAHEYGGGAYAVSNGTVVFSNYADNRLYGLDRGSDPVPLTPTEDMYYADPTIDRARGRVIVVREDHTGGGEAVNALVSVPLAGGDAGQILASGHDFYASPRLSPDGTHLAWLCWDHPNMPWDGCELWVGEIAEDGGIGHEEHVAGGRDESIFQPEWSPDGTLHFISDRSGWWNLYRRHDGRDEALCLMEAEFGLPQWVFGMSTYAFVTPRRIICAYVQGGTWRLAFLDTGTGRLDDVATPYTDITGVRATERHAAFIAGGPTYPTSVVALNPATRQRSVLRRSSDVAVDANYLSRPQAIEFPTTHGRTAHAFYYPPRDGDYEAPRGQRPPLLVMSHGGPTGSAHTTLDPEKQYWTSRGIAVLDVNYGGSTGYGRAYRERLDGQWGIVDVDDCVNGARYLVEHGLVDPHRLAITGGSAGGYTTLCALTFRDVFAAGASHYGVSDLEALARDTHKFESRYTDRLVGPYPERRDLYRERSPIHVADRLSSPVIFFQGLDDKVVPPNQSETMVAALRAKGVPVAYLTFEGEGHGFRRAETIKRALDAELYFYGRIFGFQPADPIEPVEIANMPPIL